MNPTTHVLAVNILDSTSLIKSFGTIGIIAIIFAETGLLIGLILPGDSLLFTAGVLCAKTVNGTHLNLGVILVGTALAAVIGGQTGYTAGRKMGPALFKRPDSRFFKQRYVDRSAEFFEKYGVAKGVVLARFVPIVRTLINPFAGVVKADARTFAIANAVGGVFWTTVIVLAGYALGNHLKSSNIDHVVLPVVFVILVISVIPLAIELVKARKEARAKKAEGSTVG